MPRQGDVELSADDVDVVGVAVAPLERDAPVVVDGDAVAAGVALTLVTVMIQPHPGFFSGERLVEQAKLAERNALNLVGKQSGLLPAEDFFRFLRLERADHEFSLLR